MDNYLDKIYKDSKENFEKKLNTYLREEKKAFVVTANPETLMIGKKNKEFNQILKSDKTIIVPDGIGVVKACRITGRGCEERIAGVELAQELIEEANREKKSIFLFGAKEEVVSVLATKIKETYKNVNLLGYENGYVKDKDEVMSRIASLSPDIILVALGIPAQELLIFNHYDEFKKGILMGVGGSFDVLSGTKDRAPKIFIKCNLEWLYRICKEPKRFGRFFRSNILFVREVKKAKKITRHEYKRKR